MVLKPIIIGVILAISMIFRIKISQGMACRLILKHFFNDFNFTTNKTETFSQKAPEENIGF